MTDRPQPKRYNDTTSSRHHPNMNPEQFSGDSTTLYRVQSGGADADSLGIHWTANPDVTASGLGGSGERTVHRAEVARDQIIPRGDWFGANTRRRTTDPHTGEVSTHKSQWGFDWEQEVRLRPGAELQGHATARQAHEDFTPSGRNPTIETLDNYVGMDKHAVPGTPQAEKAARFQGAQPHQQQSMLTDVTDFDGKYLGSTPSFDSVQTAHPDVDFNEVEDRVMADQDAVGRGAGVKPLGDSSYSYMPVRGKEGATPWLSELRTLPDEFQTGHKQQAPVQRKQVPGQLKLDI
jgi:hypothetical protein